MLTLGAFTCTLPPPSRLALALPFNASCVPASRLAPPFSAEIES